MLMIRNLDAGWDERRNNISDADLAVIDLTASVVPQAEELIPQQDLDKIEAEVEELTTTIVDSDLDEDFKLLLVKQLQDVRNAIFEYKIRGAVRLREAGLATLGTAILFVNHISVSEKAQKEVPAQTKKIGFGLFQLSTWIVQLATLAMKAKPLLAAFIKALPQLTGGTDIDLPELGPGDVGPTDINIEPTDINGVAE